MTFGKGGATFVCDSRVKLPFLKPNVYGVINYFITEVLNRVVRESRPAPTTCLGRGRCSFPFLAFFSPLSWRFFFPVVGGKRTSDL